jgi:hypothetical protein
MRNAPPASVKLQRDAIAFLRIMVAPGAMVLVTGAGAGAAVEGINCSMTFAAASPWLRIQTSVA